uniref:O-fucosyltransferase family protein n=1 Tax=Setaria digitata TaxID=48799 RepID=A0A915PGV3_9BILA
MLWKSARWKYHFYSLVFTILVLHPCLSDSDQKTNLFDENDSRSRLVMLNGNMYFHAARQKNISFIPGIGGSIYFGDKDLALLPDMSRVRQLVKMADLLKQQIKLKSSDIAALNRKEVRGASEGVHLYGVKQ